MSLMRSALLAASQNAWLREHAMRWRFVRRSTARFMPGETMDEALAAARQLQDEGAGAILTHLGENLARGTDAEAVTAHYGELLQRVAAGSLDAEVSVKLTQLGLDFDAVLCLSNLRALVERAEACGSFVWIDMESSACVDRTLDLFTRARSRSPRVGICLQSYLRRSAADVDALLPHAPAIRLVKGAYSEPPALAFSRKADVDENFFVLASRLLGEDARRAGARLGIGTHDGALIERLRTVVADNRVPRSAYEFEMLYGIQRGLQTRLVAEGEPLRVLVSYGESWFPWYMRRLAEKPANVWFVVRQLGGR